MNRAILSNLGFEYELAGRPVRGPVHKQEARFAYILRLVDGWHEAEPVQRVAEELLAWGMSDRARRASVRSSRSWPSAEVVRRANDKRFSHGLERELGVALPGACITGSPAQLAATSHRWLLKHPFGVAGRDAVRASFGEPTLTEGGARLLKTTDALVAEPLVEIEEEYSAHFHLLPSREVEFIGVTRLLADDVGTFRGNETGIEPPDWLLETTRRAAEAVALIGYHGPLGIDAFTGTLQGEEIRRPICEINARWSFGRLALELGSWFGGDVAWRHGPVSARPSKLHPLRRDSGTGAWLLPDWCDPGGISGTWVEVCRPPTEIAD